MHADDQTRDTPGIPRYCRDRIVGAENWTHDELVVALQKMALIADSETTKRTMLTSHLHGVVGLAKRVEAFVLLQQKTIKMAAESLVTASTFSDKGVFDASADFRKAAEDLLVDSAANTWTAIEWPDLDAFPLSGKQIG